MKRSRREFIKLTAALTFAGSGAVAAPARHTSDVRVVVIGGGFAGATCAKYTKLAMPDARVTLVESNKRFATCPFSNHVLADWRTVGSITQDYAAMRALGVEVVRATAAAIDPVSRNVTLARGKPLAYDRLVVAPGIDFRWNAIEGYSESVSELLPHAWKAGEQTLLLRKRLRAMKNGATFIIVAPAYPYRCPPALYERAGVVANYLARRKPKSKIIILDAKESFYKQDLFIDGWNRLYPGMVEWVPGAKGGRVSSVNAKTMTVEGELDKFKAGVINVVPPQMAGEIARTAGLADESGWCPVDTRTFASKRQPGIYVIGDAAIADPMPKSAAAAHSQGKIVATAIAAELRGDSLPSSSYLNTCYSLLAPNYGFAMASLYRTTPDGVVEAPEAGGVSPADASAAQRAEEAKAAVEWYARIVTDVWR